MEFIIKKLDILIENLENPFYWDNIEVLTKLINEISSILETNILQIISHKYEPQGVSIIAMIETSGISIHTYPEKAFLSVEISTCGEYCKTIDVLQFITDKLNNSGKSSVFFTYLEHIIGKIESIKRVTNII